MYMSDRGVMYTSELNRSTRVHREYSAGQKIYLKHLDPAGSNLPARSRVGSFRAGMKVRLLLGLQLLLLGALSVGGVTIAPLRRSMALGVLRKLVDLEKVGAR